MSTLTLAGKLVVSTASGVIVTGSIVGVSLAEMESEVAVRMIGVNVSVEGAGGKFGVAETICGVREGIGDQTGKVSMEPLKESHDETMNIRNKETSRFFKRMTSFGLRVSWRQFRQMKNSIDLWLAPG